MIGLNISRCHFLAVSRSGGSGVDSRALYRSNEAKIRFACNSSASNPIKLLKRF